MASGGQTRDGVEPGHSSPSEPTAAANKPHAVYFQRGLPVETGTVTWTELQARFGQPASEETAQAVKRAHDEVERRFGPKGHTKHLPSLPGRD